MQTEEVTLWSKQVSQCWNKALHDDMKQTEFNQSTSDLCVYARTQESAIIIAVYSDDLIITQTSDGMKKMRCCLEKRYIPGPWSGDIPYHSVYQLSGSVETFCNWKI